MNSFPNKSSNAEDGEVLQVPQIDFLVAVPDEKSGESVLKALSDNGYNCELEQDEKTEEWTCYCYVKMQIDPVEIDKIEKELNQLSKPYDGYLDGWALMVE